MPVSPREISGLFTVAIETENTNDFGGGHSDECHGEEENWEKEAIDL